MIKEAIEYLLSLRKPEILKIDEKIYSSTGIQAVKPPRLMMFDVHTLTGLIDVVDFYKKEEAESIIHIIGPTLIEVYGSDINEWKEREYFARARPIDVYTKNCRFMTISEFMIKLQTEFILNDAVSDLLKAIGNMVETTSISYLDDGVTPTIVSKKGIVSLEETNLSIRHTLCPMRTFDEVKQPSAEFIIRLEKQNDAIKIGLFESSGNEWQSIAIRSIKDWIKEELLKKDIINPVIIA